MSWRAIDFESWKAFSSAIAETDLSLGSNLRNAIVRIETSWMRLRQDLLDLFLPSGSEGSHAHHHYHAPSDPAEQTRVVSATIVDYESALNAFDVALELSAQAFYPGDKNPWHKMLAAAEASNASDFDRSIQYLQRTLLWARNWAIAHPLSHVTTLRRDNVGNAIWVRQHLDAPDPARLVELDTLLHEVRPEIASGAHVGQQIDPGMALCWIGSVPWALNAEGRKSFEAARRDLTFWLPYPYEVADVTNTFIDGLIDKLEPSDFKLLVFGGKAARAAGAFDIEEVPPEKSGPVDWDEPLKAVAGDPVKELELFEGYLTEFPDNPDLLYNVGVARYKLNRYEAAIEAFSRASALGGINPSCRKSWADAHYNIGAREYNAKNFASALAHYRRAVDLNPGDLQSVAHLIVATARHGSVTQALTLGAHAQALHPQEAEILYNIALALAFGKRFEESKGYLTKVLEIQADHAAAQQLLKDLPANP